MAETAKYYSNKGVEFLKDYTCEEYLKKIERIIEEEKERADRYMKESTCEKFIAVVQDELLVKNLTNLLDKNSGLDYILENHIVKDMHLIYRLYCPLQPCLKEIAQRFRIFISK